MYPTFSRHATLNLQNRHCLKMVGNALKPTPHSQLRGLCPFIGSFLWQTLQTKCLSIVWDAVLVLGLNPKARQSRAWPCCSCNLARKLGKLSPSRWDCFFFGGWFETARAQLPPPCPPPAHPHPFVIRLHTLRDRNSQVAAGRGAEYSSQVQNCYQR